MEQQAKERLTGGVILVVLLVLFVPELLTGPRPAPPAAPAQPDQAPMRSYTMELGASPHARAPVAASTTTAPTASEPTPVSSAAAPPHAADETATAPSSAAAPPEVHPATVAAAAPVRAQPATPAAGARAASKPAATHETEHPATGWTVQVGTFSSRDNALRVISGLKSHGFSAALSEASRNGHKMFRVRVGAERDRAAAQKLLGRLRAAGEKGGEVLAR